MSGTPDQPPPAKRAKTEDNTPAGSVTCAICLNDVSEMSRALPCAHRFDKACIKSSLERDDRCPTCRDVIADLETDFTPDGINKSEEVRHPEEQETLIPPDIRVRHVRSADKMLLELTVAKDAVLVFKAHGWEISYPILKDHPVYYPIVFTGTDGHDSLVRIPGAEDQAVVIPDDDDSDDDDDVEVPVPTPAQALQAQSIMRILDFLRSRLASATSDTLTVMPSSDDDSSDDDDDDTPAASPESSAPASPVTSQVTQSDPVQTIPPDEEVILKISPSVTISCTYPNGLFANFTSPKMVILKIKGTDEESAQIIRAGGIVFLPTPLIRASECTIKEDGKEYPLSQKFKELLSSKDLEHGYTRPPIDDDDDDDDSSDDDDDAPDGAAAAANQDQAPSPES